MANSRLPRRAEATNEANAILDGTDCVMLSAESGMGKYPEESVAMLAKIAAFTESHRPSTMLSVRRELAQLSPVPTTGADRMTSVIERALETVPCDLVVIPTHPLPRDSPSPTACTPSKRERGFRRAGFYRTLVASKRHDSRARLVDRRPVTAKSAGKPSH
jgi:hypothetical protein